MDVWCGFEMAYAGQRYIVDAPCYELGTSAVYIHDSDFICEARNQAHMS